MVDLMSMVIQIIVGIIIISPVLWLVGRWMVGKQKAKFTDAIWIVVLGIVINAVLAGFVSGVLGGAIGVIVTLFVWVALIKHFFDAGWGKAILIGIVAVVVLIVIVLVLGLLGFTLISGLGGLSSLGF
jgi:hypothetical protein